MDGVVVVLRRDSKYLLVEDADGYFEGLWAPVHGSVENDESVEEAAEREIEEEAGLQVSISKDDKVWRTEVDDTEGELYWFRSDSEDVVVETGEEIAEYRWLLPGRIRDLQEGEGEFELSSKSEEYFRRFVEDY
jgi:ADP-ribose pyrophosphatase YjhB (NUDIX family)